MQRHMPAIHWQGLWQAPVRATPISVWLLVLLLIGLATLLYWLMPGTERFEHWFALPPAPVLPTPLLKFLLPISHYVPDLAWSALVACAARDTIWALRWPVSGLLIMAVAAGWELAQWLSLVPGYFDPADLLLSLFAAGIVLLVPATGESV